jgi:rod shape-determining protein MreC
MRFIYTKTFAIFAGLLVTVFVLVVLQTVGWLGPVQTLLLQAPKPLVTAARAVGSPVRTFFRSIWSLKAVVRENATLHNRVTELEQKQVDFDIYKSENDLLRQEMAFKAKSSLNLLPCSVLSSDPQGLTDAVVLNCGTNQGVAEGQAVVAQGHVVAKVLFAGSTTSTALLITNTRSVLDVALSGTPVQGTLKGSFGSGLVLDLVPQNTTIEPNMLVMTAGINSQVPKGLLVGTIGQVLSKDNDLQKRASVISPVELRTLEFVFIVKP